MLSVMVSFRNGREGAINLLRSMYRTFQVLGVDNAEFVFIDDASDPAEQMPQLFAEFATQIRGIAGEGGGAAGGAGGGGGGGTMTQLLFKQHQHYTRALAYGLSACKGKHVLFVSHDML